MNYSHIISNMTWSFSRITAFEFCRYGWFLKYIYNTKKAPLFFSDFGKLMHSIFAEYLTGELGSSQLASVYLLRFLPEVIGKAPNEKVFKTYFDSGLTALKNISLRRDNVVGVERKYEFEIEGKPFIGFVDYVAQDNSVLAIHDFKSGDIKPFSTKEKKSKTDIANDEKLAMYINQQYLYSIPIKDELGIAPNTLSLNCFRFNRIITEPYTQEGLAKAKSWALESIEQITNNEDWTPNYDWFRCRYLCDVHDECEYYRE